MKRGASKLHSPKEFWHKATGPKGYPHAFSIHALSADEAEKEALKYCKAQGWKYAGRCTRAEAYGQMPQSNTLREVERIENTVRRPCSIDIHSNRALKASRNP